MFQWHKETWVTQKCLTHFSGENQSTVSGDLHQGTSPEDAFCHRASGALAISPVFVQQCLLHCSLKLMSWRNPSCMRGSWSWTSLSSALVFWVYMFFFWGNLGHVTPRLGSWWEQLVSSCRLLAGRHGDAQLHFHSLRQHCADSYQQRLPRCWSCMNVDTALQEADWIRLCPSKRFLFQVLVVWHLGSWRCLWTFYATEGLSLSSCKAWGSGIVSWSEGRKFSHHQSKHTQMLCYLSMREIKSLNIVCFCLVCRVYPCNF